MNPAFLIRRFVALTLFGVCCLHGATPKSPFYPFAPTDLVALRAISKAEAVPNSPDLALAWKLYGQVQGSWKPGASKPSKQVIAQIDELKRRLEKAPKPKWFKEALGSNRPPSSHVELPSKIGDAVFTDEADSPEYQNQKALSIVYLAEHEIDRPDAANKAGRYLTLLSVKHPWDWEVHALYARLLIDAGLADPSFHAALMSIYLNPSPDMGDLQFFGFVGACCKRDQRDAIELILREAAIDDSSAQAAVDFAAQLFKPGTNPQIVPPAKVVK